MSRDEEKRIINAYVADPMQFEPDPFLAYRAGWKQRDAEVAELKARLETAEQVNTEAISDSDI